MLNMEPEVKKLTVNSTPSLRRLLYDIWTYILLYLDAYWQQLRQGHSDLLFHLGVESFFIIIILYLWFQKSYEPKRRRERLTEKEIDNLVNEWKPEPLVPKRQLSRRVREYLFENDTYKSLPSEIEELLVAEHLERESYLPSPREVLRLQSAPTAYCVVNGKKVINLGTCNFLGFAEDDTIKQACAEVLKRYGCGSCGPRGFYGNLDVHIEAEHRIAEFMKAPAAVLYSFGSATCSSVIPAFSKRGDLIICDEAASYFIQTGISLSRASVKWFPHNDMSALEKILAEVVTNDPISGKITQRRFIIVEGISSKFADMTPLDKVVELKNRYRFRLIVDESYSLGVLGKTGRGALEYFGLESTDADIVLADLGNAIATVGGFCCSSQEVANHQRLSSAGYCFSASQPPFLAKACTVALEKLQNECSERLSQLQENIECFQAALGTLDGIRISSHPKSPIVFLRLDKSLGSYTMDEQWMMKLQEALWSEGVFVSVPQYLANEHIRPSPGLRLCISSNHSRKVLKTAAEKIRKTVAKLLFPSKHVSPLKIP
ncbi:serine palmitoyltransferase [Galdieria sulphuraria]|uniref:serine C-palmitoyltransferase n=1 Tax=Galdieria sulphuraria TaxID=130081 RepID=M2WZE8_GALSU|nr:serine palmitoyltransferase [Galdieria sulphuraria]EME29455.1 serine palmitoyltransferase [Galdieria sulphuraria]|eukprot:XP_005705975.1 serine palmitoyltransferase [Galdieria sulphuraria]